MTAKGRKSVRWSTVTVYEFGVGIGGSSVPKHGGPAIGLSKKPKCVWSTTVDAVKGALCSCKVQAMQVANSTDVSRSEILRGKCSCANASPAKHQRRRVRWFKPLERIMMLEKAGYSEKKIYRMLMESSDISMSRRVSLRVPVDATKRAQH